MNEDIKCCCNVPCPMNRYINFIYKRLILVKKFFVLIIYSLINHLYGITISGKGMHILVYSQSWRHLSSEGSLSCCAFCGAWLRLFLSHSKTNLLICIARQPSIHVLCTFTQVGPCGIKFEKRHMNFEGNVLDI